MNTGRVPVIRDLDPVQAKAILARNYVGRLAYSDGHQVYIQPIHYVYSDGWLYGRTSPGAKLSAVRHNYWVAFEVDESNGMFEWRSVVVRGGFYTLSENGTEREAADWQRGVELVRRLLRSTFTESDPMPQRTVLFRIAAQEVTGRQCQLVRADEVVRPDADETEIRIEVA